jgi:hypothetical protein
MDPLKAASAASEKAGAATAAQSAQAGATGSPAIPRPSPAANAAAKNAQPVLPPEITQYFIPVRGSGPGAATLVYHPMLFGSAEVRYSNTKSVEMTQNLAKLWEIKDGPIAVEWGQGSEVDLPVADLEQAPEAGARFTDVPGTASKPKNFDSWRKDLANWIYRNQKLELFESPSLQIASNPGESERDFRVRLQQFARERRDDAVEKLRQKYAPRIAALDEQKRRAQQSVEREAAQAKSQKLQAVISIGSTLLSSFMGRKTISLSTLGRATTAARGVGRVIKETEDVGRAEDSEEAVAQKRAALDAQFEAETAALEKSVDPQTEAFEKISLKPTKANIAIEFLSLAWAPYWQDPQGRVSSAWE